MNTIRLRWINTSANLQRAKAIGCIINKVFNFDIPKKKQKTLNTQFAPTHLNSLKSERNKLLANRRVTVLNRIFMRYITDFMATGEIAPKLLGKGIEISRIEVSPDFGSINVYWLASNANIENDIIQEILNTSAGHLQHELSQLKIVSKSFIINFIKDKRLVALKKVEEHLSSINLQTQLKEINDDILTDQYETTTFQKLEKQPNEINVIEDEFNEITIPEMKQNVMGFDHNILMNKIKTSLKKAKNMENQLQNVSEDSVDNQRTELQLDTVEFLTNQEQNKLFDNFLKEFSINEKRKKLSLSRKKYQKKDVDEFLEKINNCSYNDDEFEEEYKYDNSELLEK